MSDRMSERQTQTRSHAGTPSPIPARKSKAAVEPERLFQENPVAIAVIGLDGKILHVNDALVRMFGNDGAALVGHSFNEFTRPDDVERSDRSLNQLLSGEVEKYTLDKHYLGGDGTEILARLVVTLVTDTDGSPLYAIGVIQDISEPTRVQAQLDESNSRLTVALESAHLATWEYDAASQLITVSDNYNGILGLLPDDPHTFLSFLDNVDPEDMASFEERIRGAESGHDFSGDVRFNSPLNGSRIINDRGRVILDPEGQLLKVLGVIMDVTDERSAEELRRESEMVFRQTIEATSDAFIGIRSDGTVCDWNRSAERIFGWTAAEMVGQSIELIAPPGSPINFDQQIAGSVALDVPGELAAGPLEVTGLAKDGRQVPVELTVVGVQRDGESTVHAFARDITDRKATEAELIRQALTDEQTGLPNRALLQDRLDRALDRVSADHMLALFFIDIDQLKVLNDSLGHAAGDSALMAVVKRVTSAIRPHDTLARFTGDQFIIVSEGLDSIQSATGFAQRVLDAVALPFDLAGRELHPSVSIGIAIARSGSDQAEHLIRDADLAMYRAKRRGGNTFDLFDDAMLSEALHRLDLERELRAAIDGNQLRVYYQPVFTASGQLVSAEALVRWEHPTRGLVFPDQFIPLAESTGLIVELGHFVLRTACRQILSWQGAGIPNLSIAVNMSTRELLQPDLCASVRAVLEEEGYPPERLCMELTESALLEDSDQGWVALAALRELGVQIAIDDFGTGYSSLTYLRRFPVQILKLDRSFVSGVADESQDAAIVGSTIELAHALGLEAVAEGVETFEQLEALRGLNCDLVQGFLWSKALTATEFDTQFLHGVPPTRERSHTGVALSGG
jgi:diguanylate cyclase (GGDEF)-like protein/PAS domain S-box-containing protein